MGWEIKSQFWTPSPLKCSECGKEYKMEAGHPIYAGTYKDQYCMDCVSKLRVEGRLS